MSLRLAVAALLMAAAPLAAQRPGRHEVVLHAEPVAAGLRYAGRIASSVAAGPLLVVGPFHGVTISKEGFGELREWASLFLAMRLDAGDNLSLVLAPIGAALATGDDFGAVYPSAQGGLEFRRDRLRLGTDIRVLRIAGSYGTGNYWVQWIPLRMGIAWGS